MFQFTKSTNLLNVNKLGLTALFFAFSLLSYGQSDGMKTYQMQATKGNLTSFSKTVKNDKEYGRFNKVKTGHPEFGLLPFNAYYEGFVEVLDRREIDQRLFVNPKAPSEIKIQKSLQALHYKVNGEWVTIDHHLADKGNGVFEATNQYDPVGFNTNIKTSYIKTPFGQIDFNNWKLYGSDENGVEELIALPNWSDLTAGDDGVYIKDIFPGIDAQMVVNRGSIKSNFIVKSIKNPNYTNLVFKDDFITPLGSVFKFTNGNASSVSKSGISLVNSNEQILELGEASAYPENPTKEEYSLMNYSIDGNKISIIVPVSWIQSHIGKGKVIIDPLVSSSNTLAQASITGSMYNGSCNFINSCNYNLSVNTPANTTLTNASWSFNYLAQGVCWMEDGAIRITSGACISPSNAGFYWYCNTPTSGTCTGNNISIWNDVRTCMPAPSCAPVSVPFTLQFFRSCWGAAGCNNACIGAFSPWTMTLDGRTVEFTNAGTPFSMSNSSVCAGGNLTATSNGVQYGVPAYNINWSFSPTGIPSVGSGTSPSINFPTAGVVTLYAIVTDACGVTATGSQNINVVAIPTANPGTAKNLTCAQTTTVLNGSGGGTYSWSGPGTITTPTSQNPTVNTPGVFSLIVNVAGCNSSPANVTVTQNTTAPVNTAGTSGSVTCSNNSINLTSSTGGLTYTWTAPGGSSITGGVNNQNTTGSGPGTYTVRATDPANGCTVIATVAAQINTTAPVNTAGTSGSVTCSNNSINLTSSTGGLTYTWTAPGGSSITGGVNNQNTTGSGPGTYTVRATNPVNGCTVIATVAAQINTVAPSPSAGTSASVTCTNSVINLTSLPAGAAGYTWTAPGGSSITGGVNSQNTTGSGPGTYTVRVADAVNGCTAIATVAAQINTVAPSPSAGTSASVTCTNSVINLTSLPAGAAGYTWTAPGGSSITGGVNNQNTTGSGPGTYTVRVADAVNGCTAQAVVSAIVNTTAPTPTAGIAGVVTCGSPTVSLTSGPGAMNYTWTAPAGSSITGGVNSQNTTGSGPGSYSVLVQNPTNGCSTQTVVTASTNTTPPSPTITSPSTITCANPTITLSSPTGGVTYTWSGPGIVGSPNNSTVNVNQVGTYSLFVTSAANGCTNIATASVGNNTIAPTTTPVGTQTITCATPSVQLIGSANPSTCTVVWTGGVCAGANSFTATACGAGTYTYIATNPANGCQSAAQVATVVPNAGVPSVTVSNTGTITCTTTSVQVIGTTTTSPATYTWSGTGIVGATNTATINVNQSGVYTLTVTNTLNGCTSVVTNSITADNAAITPTTTSSTIITCTNPTSTLTTNAGAGPYTYSWSGPGVVGTTTTSIATATLGGTYTVVVTNTVNGCTGTDMVTVASNTTVPASVTVTPASYTLSCATPTTQISVGSTGGATYSWTAPGTGSIVSGATSTTATIQGPGVYSVVATATNGCSAAATTATMVADVNSPAVTLSSPNLSITCTSPAPTLTLTPTGTVTIASYSWSPASGISSGSNTTTPTFTAAGTYVCLITASNGCTITASVPVSNNTVIPSATSGAITNLSCANTSVNINPTYTPSSGLTYTWSGTGIVGSVNNASVDVNQSGTYTVSMIDPVNGCANTATFTVNGNTVAPTVTVTSTSSIGIGCLPTNTTVVLDATTTPSTGVNYNWSTTATTQSISVSAAGVYSVVITDATNGCTVSAQYTVSNGSTPPNISAGANASIPCGGVTTTVTLNGSSTDPGVTYSWSGPNIISGSNTASPVVDMAGTYTLTVTNPTTGCTATSTVDVTNSVPTASISSDVVTGFAPLTVNYTNTSTNANTFSWNFGNGSSTTLTTTAGTSATYGWGTYTITMIASSGVCSDTASIVIIVEDGFTIEVPNVFTPNDDNINDVFIINSTGVKEIHLVIFNRWGQKMYEFDGARASWDGITSDGQEASAGTYYFFIKATGFDGKEFEQNGTVNLFR